MKKPTSTIASQDDTYFEEYLQGDSQLSKLYQKTTTPEPPETLDQSILSAAVNQTSAHTTAQAITASQRKNPWWTKAGSWAATFAIFSLLALVTHKTWLEEQQLREGEYLPQDVILQDQIQQDIHSGQTGEESDTSGQTQQEVFSNASVSPAGAHLQTPPSAIPVKQHIIRKEQNDSRKLLYKSAPAATMQAAPEFMQRSKMDYQAGSIPDSLHSYTQGSSMAIDKQQKQTGLEEKVLDENKITVDLSSDEQQIWLHKINHLIKEKQFDKAKALLKEFRIKYPDASIDPTIIQSLSS